MINSNNFLQTNYNKFQNIPLSSDFHTSNNLSKISFGNNNEDFLSLTNLNKSDSEDKNNNIFSKAKKGISNFYNKNKTRLWLSTQVPTLRSLKAYCCDTGAYLYEIDRPNTGKVTNKEVIAEIDIKRRKENKTDKAKIRKVEFDDSTTVYTIQKGVERLGFIDVDFSEKGIAYIDYASTVVGREDYRNLLMILMQSMVEDYAVKNNEIPCILAEPAPIGEMDFDRAALYKFYGADSIQQEDKKTHKERTYTIMNQSRIYDMLNKINDSKKRNFITQNFAEFWNKNSTELENSNKIDLETIHKILE